MSYRIGIDVGGTFTDFVLTGGEDLTLLKSLTTHEDQSIGVMQGIAALAETEGTTLRALAAEGGGGHQGAHGGCGAAPRSGYRRSTTSCA